MQVAFDHINLKPPRPGRWSMPMLLAVGAHLLLIAALTWGVHWKQDAQPVSFDAELWSAVPQQAAPREVAPPPPPPREAKVEPKVQPKPEPKPEPKAEPKPPDTREADIATAQAKKKKEEAEKREAEKKAAKEKANKLEKEKKAEEAEKLKQKKAADQKALDDKIKKLDDAKQKVAAQKAEAAAAKAREDQMRRIMGQAGATGDANAKGTAQRSSGPSAGYAGRVRARIKPNVLFTDDIAGNPKTDVEVTTAPDGTIISRRLVKSSGVAEWDKAALAAIDRTGTLPRDVDGRVPSPMIIELSPRE